jgi:hypothetical protein
MEKLVNRFKKVYKDYIKHREMAKRYRDRAIDLTMECVALQTQLDEVNQWTESIRNSYVYVQIGEDYWVFDESIRDNDFAVLKGCLDNFVLVNMKTVSSGGFFLLDSSGFWHSEDSDEGVYLESEHGDKYYVEPLLGTFNPKPKFKVIKGGN